MNYRLLNDTINDTTFNMHKRFNIRLRCYGLLQSIQVSPFSTLKLYLTADRTNTDLGLLPSTAIWRACLAEIWISCLFFTLNWIAMLGIKYFGHLEHYCFEKMLSQIFPVDLWRHRWRHTDLGANWKSGNDVIIVYFWLSEFFLIRFFVYLVYFRPYLTEMVQKIYTKLTTIDT